MAKDITVTIDKAKLDELRRKAPQKVGMVIRAMAFDGERDVKMSFGTSPSVAPNPPGVDTGALRASIYTEKLQVFTWQISVGVEYGAYLEYGTSKGLEPRPFMMPMAMRLQKNVDNYFKNFID